MTTEEAILTRRSIRKFSQERIDREALKEIVNAARLAPQAANIQPLTFAVADKKEICDKIFKHTKWAKLLGEKGQPKENEAPTAYIAVLQNKSLALNKEADACFAIENAVLYAWEKGIGSCILGAINRPEISEIIGASEEYELIYIVALGYPCQKSVFEESDGDVKYYMDGNGTVHVPKRQLSEVLRFVGDDD